MSSASELPPPGTFGPFVPVAKIGAGGFGAVYKVRDQRTGAEYALKAMLDAIIAEDYVERFRREMQALASVDHPGVVKVHGSGKTAKGAPYYVMELLEGESLGAVLARRKKLPASEACALLSRVARAVGAVHARGIVHRDLKPENIVLDGSGAPRIVDFGLTIHERVVERLTRAGELMGTARYMAPEQLGGKPPTTATDVWALGVTLYQLTTGRLPFEAGTELAICQAIMTREPPLPSSTDRSVPSAIDKIFLRCCEKDLDRRYRTAIELALDLEAFARGEAPTAAGRARAHRRTSITRWIVLGVAVTSAAASLVVAIRALHARDQANAAATLAAARDAELRKRAASALAAFDPAERSLEALTAPATDLVELARAPLPADLRPALEAARPLAELVLRDPSEASAAWNRLLGARSDAASLLLGARLAVAAGDAVAARDRLALVERSASAGRERVETLVLLLVARTGKSLEERVCAGLDALDRGAPASALPSGFRAEAAAHRESLNLAALELLSRIASREPVPATEARDLSTRLDRARSSLAQLDPLARTPVDEETRRRNALRAWASHPGSTDALAAAEQAFDAGQKCFLEAARARRQGDIPRALELLGTIIQNTTELDDCVLLARKLEIYILLEAGRPAEALDHLRAVPANLTNYSPIRLARAWCALLAGGDARLSVRELDALERDSRSDRFLANSPELGEALLVRALLEAFKLDDSGAALRDLRRVVEFEQTEPGHRVLATVVTILLEEPGPPTARSLRALAGSRQR